jgi:outer membrane lipoprotein-sorting protein
MPASTTDEEEQTVRTKCGLFLICAVVSLGAAAGMQSPTSRTLHYEARFKSASFGDLGIRKMWIKGSNMRWESKDSRLDLRIVKNGQGVFMIPPFQKIWAQYPKGTNRENPMILLPGPVGPPRDFLKAVKAVARGRETVNKQPCSVYTYTEPTTMRDCRIWIDAKSGKPVKLVVKGIRGKADTITATYTHFVLGASIPDSLFEMPKGYAVKPMPVHKLSSDTSIPKQNSIRSG